MFRRRSNKEHSSVYVLLLQQLLPNEFKAISKVSQMISLVFSQSACSASWRRTARESRAFWFCAEDTNLLFEAFVVEMLGELTIEQRDGFRLKQAGKHPKENMILLP